MRAKDQSVFAVVADCRRWEGAARRRSPFLLALLLVACSSVSAPDVVGQDVGYATGLLKGSGLEVVVVEQEEGEVTAGQVLSQDPPSGSKLSEGDPVTLVVAAPPIFEITGTFTLGDWGGSLKDCYGTDGYDDISEGVTVTVRSETGTILGTGNLGPGSANAAGSCVFPILVENVPKASFYSIEVSHRGEIAYSFEEMQAEDWQVLLSLG